MFEELANISRFSRFPRQINYLLQEKKYKQKFMDSKLFNTSQYCASYHRIARIKCTLRLKGFLSGIHSPSFVQYIIPCFVFDPLKLIRKTIKSFGEFCNREVTHFTLISADYILGTMRLL